MEDDMNTNGTPTRRSFLKVGAVLAAPLAAVIPVAARASDDSKARLATLEDEGAIRELQQSWLRRFNAGAADEAAKLSGGRHKIALDSGLRSIVADHAAEPLGITVADGGNRASGTLTCIVEHETELEQDCTLAMMAHHQGAGFVRTSERRLLRAEYAKSAKGWTIAKLELAEA
jgi:hypothetical protein